MKRLQDKLKGLSGKLVDAGKMMAELAYNYAKALAVVAILAVIVLKLPEIQNKYYHAKVGNKVYMIRDSEQSGGGTGFAVHAPSGHNYILTNDHVCEVSSDGRTVLVSGPEGSMRRNIVAHDENSDLCLIEGMPGVDGLTVAGSGPHRGDMLAVVGHPRLAPLHVSYGEVTGASDVSFLNGPISFIHPDTGEEEVIPTEQGGIPLKQCMLPKNDRVWVDLDMLFFTIRVQFCLTTVKDAYSTGIIIHPGNSGSPVVNFWGNVVGVAFAGDSTNWGRMVPIQDIKAFLKNY